jgi:hypothetical protein
VSTEKFILHGFNRGIISPLALARVDLEKTGLAAETMTNFVPRVLGSMMFRPGAKYLGSSYSDSAAHFIPFVFSVDDTALIEITDSLVRVWVDDEVITRTSVSTAVTNGNFDSDVSSWTDSDESGATSAWATGGYLSLIGNGTNSAIRDQQVTVAFADQNVEHALKIVINGGTGLDGAPVTLRVGSTSGGDEYIADTLLETGTHSIAFTPTGDFYIRFSNRSLRTALVSSCNVESSGAMTITAPWSSANLDLLRYDQSGDIIFIACDGYRQYKIVRRSARSWSVEKYYSDDGPFRTINISTITITPSALSGTCTLTASKALFNSGLVGALFRLSSSGQTVTSDVSAQNSFTNTINITGTGSSRAFTITRSGTWVATITLQRSLTSDTGPWEDVTTYTTNATISYNDALDNQEAWYRIGVKTGDYTSGTVTLTLYYALGSIEGIARVTTYTSSTVVNADIIEAFGATTATADWEESKWSDYRGWPTSVSFSEGRLWWAGYNGVVGSISDDYYSFDDTIEGDSGVIDRTIGTGPVDTINWILGLQRLILGTEGNEIVCKSSSFDEPLTPTAFSLKIASTQGSSTVESERLDNVGIYVQRGGTRIMELAIDVRDGEYGSNDLTLLNPEICQPYVTRISIQRQPDTRIHCVRSDGKVAILVYDSAENVKGWCLYETDGTVEDVVILPRAEGQSEDAVYYHVNRTINGSTKRYLEKWYLESQCEGSTLSRNIDCAYEYSDVSATAISGLDHLEGETVVVWGNSKDLGSYTVSSGSITLSEAVTSAIIGLSYTGQWKSMKLSYTQNYTSLLQKKKINHLGVMLRNTHYQGLEFGPDFTTMDNLPLVENGAATASDTVHSTYDEDMFEFPGQWDTDARLCLRATAPKPCNILAAVVGIEIHGKN